MSDHLEVGVTDPVGDLISAQICSIQLNTHGGPGSSEEVIKDSNLMTEKHQSINQVRSNETGTTSDWRSASRLSSRIYSLKILFRSELGRSLTGGNLATVVY